MKKFFFSINTQFSNLGDALINRELIKVTTKAGSVEVDTSRCPESFLKTINLSNMDNLKITESYFRLFINVILSRVKGVECFYFLNPGGLGANRSNKQRVSAFLYNLILSLFSLLGVKVCQIGVSYDRLSSTDIKIARYRSRILYKLYVRDHGSHEYLKSHGFNVTGICPDLAFLLEPFNESKLRNKIGFSFRGDGRSGMTLEEMKDIILKSIEYYGRHYRYSFVSQVEMDNVFMVDLKKWFDKNFELESELLLCTDDIGKIATAYSEFSYIYSNRLHVLLLAGFSGCIPVATIDKAKNIKVFNLFNDVGLKGLIKEIDQNYTPEVTVESSHILKVFKDNNKTLTNVIYSIFS